MLIPNSFSNSGFEKQLFRICCENCLIGIAFASALHQQNIQVLHWTCIKSLHSSEPRPAAMKAPNHPLEIIENPLNWKSIGNQRKAFGNHLKSIGTYWKSIWESCKIQWKSKKKPMEIIENAWVIIENPMEIYWTSTENQWKSIGNHRKSNGKSIGNH